MIRIAWLIAGTMALLSGGCAVYGTAGTASVQVDGDTGRVTADSWEGSVACGVGPGQPPCAGASVREQIR